MKKLTTLLTLMAGVGIALSQGIVNFNNNGVPTPPDHKVYFDFVGHLPGVVGTNYLAELYYVDPADSVLKPVAVSISKFRVTSTGSPGTWSGKTVTFPAGIGGVNTPVTLVVRAWDSLIAASYESALAACGGYIGESNPFTYTQIISTPVPQTTDTQMVNMPAFALTVPEPSAIALSVIGVAGLLFLRRRK